MFDKLGGRKFVALVLLIGAGVAVDILAPKGLSSNLMNLMVIMGGVYVGGNVLRAGVDKIKVSRKTGEIKGIKELQEALREVQVGQNTLVQYQDAILQTSQVNQQGLTALIETNATKKEPV